ncbi:MAG: hypothetical protein AB8B87_22235 [Granulosicoccus sp.]
MIKFIHRLCIPLIFGVAVLSVASPTIAQEVDPEWPCIQRLIPEVSPAVMWPVPVEDGMRAQYRQDSRIKSLAEELGDIETFTEAHQQSIEDFAEGVSESERELQLTLLATGVVDVSNRVRKDYISGIKRYTRQQIAISEQIEETLNELSLLEAQELENKDEARQDITDTLRWHERVYDQRERSIQLLCEAPVELEQQLSEVLRYAAQYLP